MSWEGRTPPRNTCALALAPRTAAVVVLFDSGFLLLFLSPAFRSLDDLCKKYVGTKFVKIISTDCIPKYPDQLLPTLLLYKNKKVMTTLEGKKKSLLHKNKK